MSPRTNPPRWTQLRMCTSWILHPFSMQGPALHRALDQGCEATSSKHHQLLSHWQQAHFPLPLPMPASALA